MTYCSVLLAERDAVATVGRMLPELCEVLAGLGGSFEVICIDDHSSAKNRLLLKSLLADYSRLRMLRLDEGTGLAAALTAGIFAARGEVVVAIEASDRYTLSDIPRLIQRLSRADLVCGCRRRNRLSRLWLAMSHMRRQLFRGQLVRDPDCLFWAARREAIQGLQFTHGMNRYLSSLVVKRGYRVSELHVAHQWHSLSSRINTDWLRLPTAWWKSESATVVTATELMIDSDDCHETHLGTKIRIDPAQPLFKRDLPSAGLPQDHGQQRSQ